MKNSIKYLGLVLIYSSLTLSCLKSKDDETTHNYHPIVGTWNMVACSVSPPIDFYYDNLRPCQKDDLETFYSDYSYLYDEGPTKCNWSDPQIPLKGSWSVSGNKLLLTFDSSVIQKKIIFIDCCEMHLSDTLVTDSISYSIYKIYVKR